MTTKERLEQEYASLAGSIGFDAESIDRSRVGGIVRDIDRMAMLTNSALAIYDNTRMEHIYESPAQKDCFRGEDGSYDGISIHPEDYEAVLKDAIASTKFVFKNNRNALNLRMIRTYRAFAYGKFRNITERFIPLETDAEGNIWLLLSAVDISVDQASPANVKSIIIDKGFGDVFSLSDKLYSYDKILSDREMEILRLIAQGKLSKEIVDILHISVATVNTHRQHILQHLNAGLLNRTSLDGATLKRNQLKIGSAFVF